MTREPGGDHPAEQSEAEVTLAGLGISVSTRVELVGNGVLTLRPSVGEYVEQVVAAAGDQVEVFWKAAEQTRALPAEVLQVEHGAAPRWRLQITGPAEVSQRRKAVRARVALPIEVGYGSIELSGETIDLSEAGIRAMCDALGVPPDAGARLDLDLQFEDGALAAKAEIIRVHPRGARWLLSIRFVDLPDKDGDRVRRRVFQALREERARQSD
jgi:PilZ domain